MPAIVVRFIATGKFHSNNSSRNRQRKRIVLFQSLQGTKHGCPCASRTSQPVESLPGREGIGDDMLVADEGWDICVTSWDLKTTATASVTKMMQPSTLRALSSVGPDAVAWHIIPFFNCALCMLCALFYANSNCGSTQMPRSLEAENWNPLKPLPVQWNSTTHREVLQPAPRIRRWTP